MDANFDQLDNYNSLARRELALLEVLARLAGDVIKRGQSELFSRYEQTIRDYETRFQATFDAGKYGSLSTNSGRVDIGRRTDGDSLVVSWTESEGPSVSPPKRRGFGSIVVEAMAARSVDGVVHLDYPPSGLTWRLSCPAANALEPGA